MRILIVEDNADLTRQIKSTLEHAMYVVDVAYDGEEGHFLGETEHYDAIILDLGLPKMDGLDVLERWRASGNRAPVLILGRLYQFTSRLDLASKAFDRAVSLNPDSVEAVRELRIMRMRQDRKSARGLISRLLRR